ncbi:MAG: hypothetical protein SEPTF4163_005829, partial [Sporothrix epigloea]
MAALKLLIEIIGGQSRLATFLDGQIPSLSPSLQVAATFDIKAQTETNTAESTASISRTGQATPTVSLIDEEDGGSKAASQPGPLIETLNFLRQRDEIRQRRDETNRQRDENLHSQLVAAITSLAQSSSDQTRTAANSLDGQMPSVSPSP